MTSSPRPGLLFDLDGTLAHTDPTHLLAFNDILAPHGMSVDAAFYNANMSGRHNPEIFAALFPQLDEAAHLRMADEKEALFRARAGGLRPAKGLIDLLDRAAASGVPCIVVTNAPRANALMMLEVLALGGRFDGLVIGDEVAFAKPHPEPYLVGLQRLGASAERAVAFEDSRSGVRSAAAAGLAVVGLSSSLDEATLREAGAALVAPDFTDPALIALVRERTGMA